MVMSRKKTRYVENYGWFYRPLWPLPRHRDWWDGWTRIEHGAETVETMLQKCVQNRNSCGRWCVGHSSASSTDGSGATHTQRSTAANAAVVEVQAASASSAPRNNGED